MDFSLILCGEKNFYRIVIIIDKTPNKIVKNIPIIASGTDHLFDFSIFFCCSCLVIITLLSSLSFLFIEFWSPNLLNAFKSLIIFRSVSGKSV